MHGKTGKNVWLISDRCIYIHLLWWHYFNRARLWLPNRQIFWAGKRSTASDEMLRGRRSL